jgi:NADP-dependent 3-hydroxy acid dehydrogenase YdfG
MRLAQRRFSSTDQQQFASCSGDYNPIHVDPVEARRTQAGAPVVHGIHLLLWALDSIVAEQRNLPRLRGVRAQFNKFVFLEEHVEVIITDRTMSRVRLSISVDNAPRCKISLEFGDMAQDFDELQADSSNLVEFTQWPLAPSFMEMKGQRGRLELTTKSEEMERMFPLAAEWLGLERLFALAASSYLVGMICPGLYSIYSELRVRTCARTTPERVLDFQVTDADARFRSVQMRIIGGGWEGTIESSARTPPVQQATMESLRGVVGPADFSQSVALIVGGSRGLGELTAKLVASGGGRVIITWQSGRGDAERVAEEIRSAGGICETQAYDARRPAAEQIEALLHQPTHAYYFATPMIGRHRSDVFSGESLAEFLTIYVDGFWKLAKALYVRRPNLRIFYPSSVFVTERPPHMTEYTMAKAAGEILCADMNISMESLRVIVRRLPRLLTDQTASNIEVETSSALDTMLPIVLDVQL